MRSRRGWWRSVRVVRATVTFVVLALLATFIFVAMSPATASAAAGQAPSLGADWQNITAGGDASNVDAKTVNLSATGNADTAVSGKLDVVAMIDTGFNMGNGSVDAATNAIKALASQVLSINTIMGDTNTATAPVNLDVGFFSTAQPAALANAHTGFKAKASDLTGLTSTQIQSYITNSRDTKVTTSQSSSYWDTAFNFVNSLTTRSGAKKVFMFITSGYPATSASNYGTDYVNPIVLGGTTMPLTSSPIATMVKNNWNIYNVSLDQAVYPCWDVKKQTTGTGQCYINVNTTWSATANSSGQSAQFYDTSLYKASTSRPSGSTLTVGTKTFNQWLTPFESLEYYERAANPSNTNVIQNLKATTATATQSFLDIADTLMNQFFMKPATFSQKFNSTYVAPVNAAALPTDREQRLQQGDTDMSATYGVSFAANGMSADQLAAVKRLTKIYYTNNTLQVTVPFIPNGTQYTVSYKVKPTQAAYDAVMAKNDVSYKGPDTGDANTGTLSAGKQGFFVDAAKGDTKVTYVSYSGENTDPYSLKKYEPLNSVLGIDGVPVIPSTSQNPELMTRSVVTVTMQSIPVTKQWSPVAPTGASATASLYVDGSTTAAQTVTLNAANNYSASFTNLAPNHTYNVKETGLDNTLYSSTVYRADLGGLKAWGDNTSGKLGTGSAATSPIGVTFKDASGNKLSPQPVIQSISASAGHTLAIDSNGAIWAWGSNSNGQLGDGTTVDKSSPVKLDAGSTTFKQVAAGAAFSVALDSTGNVWTWGSDSSGQLGNGSTTGNVLKPTSIGFSAVKVAAGDAHVLALKSVGGAVWSWGSNASGQLGQYTTSWAISSKRGTPMLRNNCRLPGPYITISLRVPIIL